VIARVGVAHVGHASPTHGGVGRDRAALATTAAVATAALTATFGRDDLEGGELRFRFGDSLALRFDRLDACERRVVLTEYVQKPIDVLPRAFQFDERAGVAAVANRSTETEIDRRPVDERPEADALDDAVDPDGRSFHRRRLRNRII